MDLTHIRTVEAVRPEELFFGLPNMHFMLY